MHNIKTFIKSVLRKKTAYEKALTDEEWGKLYNPSIVDNLVKNIKDENVSIWSKHLVEITQKDEKILEIGCGTGITSVYLAMHGRNSTALDFSEEALACATELASRTNVDIHSTFADATKPLPFKENEFDTVFQAGLLEHFDRDERISLLRNWGGATKRMISLIPNAASIAYRTGKAMMEANGTWPYGKECPQYSLAKEFEEAGFENITEYTIGKEHALQFLPEDNYLRIALDKWMKENACDDDCHQGYLLVTIGTKK